MNKLVRHIIAFVALIAAVLVTSHHCDAQTVNRKSVKLGVHEQYDRNHLQNRFANFTLFNEGMVGRQCRVMLEDVDGYVWVGTNNGIARFDGIRFETFFVSEGRNKNGNVIQAMCEDTVNHCIWASFFSRNELVCLNYRTYQQKVLSYDIDPTSDSHERIQSMDNYNDTLLMVKNGCGLHLLNKNTGEVFGEVKKFKQYNFLCSGIVRVNDKEYTICDNDLVRLVGREVPTPRFELTSCLGADMGMLRHISKKNDSTLVVEGHRTVNAKSVYTLYEYDVNHDTKTPILTRSGTIKVFACASDGIWITMGSGDLAFYDYETKEVTNYLSRQTGIRDNNMADILLLRNQPVLFLSSREGLIKLDYYESKFHFVDIRQQSESSSCKVFMVHRDYYGAYWMWTRDGMYYKGPDEYLFKRKEIKCDGKDPKTGVFKSVEDTINHKMYFLAVRDLVCYDQKTGKTILVNEHNDGRTIIGLIVRKDGTLMVVDANKVYVYDPIKNKRTFVTDIEGAPSRLTSAALDGDSLLWLGDNKSRLMSFNLKTKKMSFHATIGEKQKSVNKINVLYRNDMRELWISSENSGLYYYLPDKRHLTKIEYSPLFYSNMVNMEVDHDMNVWASFEDGIVCINNVDGNVYEYRKDHYNIDIDFTSFASCVTCDGTVIMGGTNGFVEFDDKNFSYNNYFPAPVVASYRFSNSRAFDYDNFIETENYAVNDTIVVPEGIRSLQLQPRVLNYNGSRRNIIQWRVKDSQDNKEKKDEWHTISAMTPIAYSNLPRGFSSIEMRSCDQSGFPTSNVKTITIDKRVYYYEHPLFYIVPIVIAIILIAILVWARSYSARRRRMELEAEVDRQAGEILRANIELTHNQTIIEKQNKQLIMHRDSLERQVAERTYDLEVARQKAEDSSRLKSAFLANLSHEVRTPMNCIVGFSKLLADPACSKSEQQEFVHLIQESSQSMLVLIGDLLDVSRIESGQLRVNMKDFNVGDEVHDVFGILSVERKNPNVKFLLDADRDKLNRVIYSDKDRFRQIIINLCYNAFKFTEKGYVSIHAEIIRPHQLMKYDYQGAIETKIDCDLLLVRVEDTGIGIPEDKTQVIFEPFRKLNNNKTLYPGLGLGLNIVKNLVELLKGHIWLTSVEHHGTTFYFYLPFDNEPPLTPQQKN